MTICLKDQPFDNQGEKNQTRNAEYEYVCFRQLFTRQLQFLVRKFFCST